MQADEALTRPKQLRIDRALLSFTPLSTFHGTCYQHYSPAPHHRVHWGTRQTGKHVKTQQKSAPERTPRNRLEEGEHPDKLHTRRQRRDNGGAHHNARTDHKETADTRTTTDSKLGQRTAATRVGNRHNAENDPQNKHTDRHRHQCTTITPNPAKRSPSKQEKKHRQTRPKTEPEQQHYPSGRRGRTHSGTKPR